MEHLFLVHQTSANMILADVLVPREMVVGQQSMVKLK
jgi:hypothetical protein